MVSDLECLQPTCRRKRKQMNTDKLRTATIPLLNILLVSWKRRVLRLWSAPSKWEGSLRYCNAQRCNIYCNRKKEWMDGRMDEWKEIRDPLEQKTWRILPAGFYFAFFPLLSFYLSWNCHFKFLRLRTGDSTGSVLSQTISGGLDINLQPYDKNTGFVAVQSFSVPSVAPKILWSTRALTFISEVSVPLCSQPMAVGERLGCKMKLRGSRINERMSPFPSRITSKYT